MRWVILGNGVMGKWLSLRVREEFPGDELLQISSPLLKSCSKNTTSMVSLNGVKRGLSPLGDLISDSYDCFEKEIKSFHSFEKASQTFISKDRYLADLSRWGDLQKGFEDEDFKVDKSFGVKPYECYLIATEKYLDELDEKIEASKYEGTVVKINSNTLELINGEKINFDQLIVASGAYSKLFPLGKTSTFKVSPGFYKRWKWDFKRSFCLSFDGMSLIYRLTDKTLLLGTYSKTEKENPDFACTEKELKEKYSEFQAFFKTQTLPKFHTGELRWGVRSKARKRMPAIDKLDQNIWEVGGLYKNGFLLSPHVSKLSIEKIKNALSW